MISIDITGITDFEAYVERFPRVARESMRLAINDTARDFAMKALRRDITEEVAFPEGYLERQDRLRVYSFATDYKLEARIQARDRPTSLARFTRQGTPVVRRGVRHPDGGTTVTVKPGNPRHFRHGFLVGLNSGNVGFAIRLRPGERVLGVDRFQPVQLWKNDPNVFLLYGPSVNQVLPGAADNVAPEVISELDREFMRQFTRLSGADK